MLITIRIKSSASSFFQQAALNSVKQKIVCGQISYAMFVTIIGYISGVAAAYNIVVKFAVHHAGAFPFT